MRAKKNKNAKWIIGLILLAIIAYFSQNSVTFNLVGFTSERCTINVNGQEAVVSCSASVPQSGASDWRDQFSVDSWSLRNPSGVAISQDLCTQYKQSWDSSYNQCIFTDFTALKAGASGTATHTAAYNGQVEPCSYIFPLGVYCGRFSGYADTSNSQTVNLVATFKNPSVVPNPTCTPNWVPAGQWSVCANSVQTRLMSDGCGNSRTDSQSCSSNGGTMDNTSSGGIPITDTSSSFNVYYRYAAAIVALSLVASYIIIRKKR